ncbi:COG4705 family protein [Thermomonas sp.]
MAAPLALPAQAGGMLNKVPAVTLFFWIIKVMATTVGETGADFLIFNVKLGLTTTSWLMGGVLLIALAAQISARLYIPWLYWVAVVLISIVGTLITDNLTDNFGVALETSTLVFSVALAAIFAAWYASERTLSIHTIVTRKRELFYWAAILITFALGTAAGDLVGERWALGYLVSGLIFAAGIAAVAIAYYVFKISEVWAFWLAYILTRPLGASFGDLLSQTRDHGGLGLGTTGTSIAFLLVIIVLVSYLSITKRDVDTSAT